MKFPTTDPGCPFCNCSEDEMILQNRDAFVRFDKYPVSEGHLLIIPRRHFTDFFDGSPEEISACMDLIWLGRKMIEEKFNTTDFNIGINIGTAAGQTISHMHIHPIPRRAGDLEDPTGGVRNIFPGKGIYPTA